MVVKRSERIHHMAVAAVEKSKAEQFGERTLQIINDAALALMMSIGHRTGLFDAMADLAPSSVDEIARAAGLNERYVREWLGAMVTGGIVDYDAVSGRVPSPAGAFGVPDACLEPQ